jgi:ABC-type bacteriocin/lantibiotic exporter with double-glycine peptidase domain
MWKDCETELDYLDFDYLVSILNSVLRDDSLLPSSIGVYGDWGSGKSSLLKMSGNALIKR